eukprot:scaffold94512_cov31-Tisochrysis_lutea.AAC.3
MEVLAVVPISQSSATQRAGRAGRTAPGEVWRLYTEEQAATFLQEQVNSDPPSPVLLSKRYTSPSQPPGFPHFLLPL